MDLVTLSRLQFGLTTIYHWLFVPLTLGLGWFVAFFQTRYYQTKDETWHKMAKFWGKLFLINFAIGVVTGIVQEFQFGMNWSEYSRYVGDIFGAPLAIEALHGVLPGIHFPRHLDFWRRHVFLKKFIWLPSGWLPLAQIFQHYGSCSPMAVCKHPRLAMCSMKPMAALELVNFFALIGNPKGWIFFWHTISDGLAMAAFMILAVSAYHLFRKQNVDFFKRSFQIASWLDWLPAFWSSWAVIPWDSICTKPSP